MKIRALGGYSQKFLQQILKIFVTLTWILEPIEQKKQVFLLFVTSTFTNICFEKHFQSIESQDIKALNYKNFKNLL